MFDINIFANLLDELGDNVDYYSYCNDEDERIFHVDIHDEDCSSFPLPFKSGFILEKLILVDNLYQYLEKNAISKKGVKYCVGDFSVIVCRDSYVFG